MDNLDQRWPMAPEKVAEIRALEASVHLNLSRFWNNPKGHTDLVIKYMKKLEEISSDLTKL